MHGIRSNIDSSIRAEKDIMLYIFYDDLFTNSTTFAKK